MDHGFVAVGHDDFGRGGEDVRTFCGQLGGVCGRLFGGDEAQQAVGGGAELLHVVDEDEVVAAALFGEEFGVAQ